MSNLLDCKIIANKDGKAQIEIAGQKVFVPSKNLPANLQGHIKLFFIEEEGSITNKDLAKTILEEILNGK